MGLLHTDVAIENPARRGLTVRLTRGLVDTGAELSWAPATVLETLGVSRVKMVQRFTMVDGRPLDGQVGFATLHAGGEQTVDEVVFARPGDPVLLGARTLEGLKVRADLVEKRLVAAGPRLAAVAA